MNDEEIHNHKYFTPLHHEIAGQLGMKQTPNYATWDVVEETAPVQVVDRIVRFIEERDKSRDQQIALAAQENGVAWAIKVVDDLHLKNPYIHSNDSIDMTYKGIKNTIRDRYKVDIGIDPAPNYPIHATLKQAQEEESND